MQTSSGDGGAGRELPGERRGGGRSGEASAEAEDQGESVSPFKGGRVPLKGFWVPFGLIYGRSRIDTGVA